MFENPVEHTSVIVKDAIQVNNSEALVIYRDCRAAAQTNTNNSTLAQETGALSSVVKAEHPGSDSSISRRVLQGPALFVPHADEWVHNFTWTSMRGQNDAGEETQRKKFAKLQLNTQALHYTVPKVRTSDEACLDISLVVCCSLVDIDKMLDATSDPMRDIAQALTADVTKFGGSCSLEVSSRVKISKKTMRKWLTTFTQLPCRSFWSEVEVSTTWPTSLRSVRAPRRLASESRASCTAGTLRAANSKKCWIRPLPAATGTGSSRMSSRLSSSCRRCGSNLTWHCRRSRTRASSRSKSSRSRCR